jgi:hypothetical protein
MITTACEATNVQALAANSSFGFDSDALPPKQRVQLAGSKFDACGWNRL